MAVRSGSSVPDIDTSGNVNPRTVMAVRARISADDDWRRDRLWAGTTARLEARP